MALSDAVDLLLSTLRIDPSGLGPPEPRATIGEFLGAVFFGPAIETFLLAGTITIISLLSSRRFFVATAAALLWGAWHATFGALWFFGTVWSFFVFSCSYLAWRRVSFSRAYWAAAIPHAIVNATVMCILFFTQSPNPSIERTAQSKLWSAAHVER